MSSAPTSDRSPRQGRVRTDPQLDLSQRARAWVERSCREQGVPVKITDPLVLQRIADILCEARETREATADKSTRAA